MTNNEKFIKLMVDSNKMKVEHPELRFGQAMMNTLSDIDEKVHNEICMKEADCFFLDSKINLFIYEVIKEWDIK
jgi:hypothetical protein